MEFLDTCGSPKVGRRLTSLPRYAVAPTSSKSAAPRRNERSLAVGLKAGRRLGLLNAACAAFSKDVAAYHSPLSNCSLAISTLID